MATGKLSYFYLHIHSLNRKVPFHSLMDILTAFDVKVHNVDKNAQRVSLKCRLQETMSVDTHAYKMDNGKKDNIQEFIETSKL